MTWKPILKDLARFYQESRNLRKRHGTVQKHQFENLQKTCLPKEEIERNIDKLHRAKIFDHETQTQPIIVKVKVHSFKEEIYHQEKKLAKEIKVSQSLTKRRSDILQQVQYIVKEESSDELLNEEDGTVKFVFANVHRTLKIVLSKPYKKSMYLLLTQSQSIFKSSTK